MTDSVQDTNIDIVEPKLKTPRKKRVKVKRDPMKTNTNSWVKAVKKWNKTKNNASYTIPKKDSEGYKEVKALMVSIGLN